MRPPHADMFIGMTRLEERIRTLVREVFAFYERFPAFGRIRGERHQFEALERGIPYEEQNRRALIAAAFHDRQASERLRALVFSLLDFNVYQNLRSCGVEHDAAVDEIANILLARAHEKENQ